MLIDQINNELLSLKDNSCYRTLKKFRKNKDYTLSDDLGNKFTSFSCNDYLGMSQNYSIINNSINIIRDYGIGTASARLTTGHNELFEQLEKDIADYYDASSALIYNSGYAANIGLISTLADQNSLIIADKACHASLIDGIKLSGAKLKRFNHNDINHCRKILLEYRNRFKKCFIITQTIFSMNGTLCDISSLHNIIQEFNSILITDDAHGIGIFNHKILSQNHIITGSFAKAIASYGGFVVAGKEIVEYLKNKSRTFIFSSSLPPNILATSIASLKVIQNMEQELRTKAISNAEYFCNLLNIPHNLTHIIPIIVGSNKKALELSKILNDNNIIAIAIRTPSVPKNTARLRLTFTNYHNKEEIEKLAELITNNMYSKLG